MKLTQKQWVISRLLRRGVISRDDSYRAYNISRLSSIISILKKEGWEFVGLYSEHATSTGDPAIDYTYVVDKYPTKLLEETENV